MRVGAGGVALGGLAFGVQFQQIAGDLLHRLAGCGPWRRSSRPSPGATAVGSWLLAHAHVAGQPVGLVDGHVQLVALGILDEQIFALDLLDLALHQPAEAADAKVHVHHVIAVGQVGVVGLRDAAAGARAAARPRWASGRAQPKTSESVSRCSATAGQSGRARLAGGQATAESHRPARRARRRARRSRRQFAQRLPRAPG